MIKKFIAFICLLATINSAHAGFRLNKTRLIFNEKDNYANITFVNVGSENYLVEAAVLAPDTGKVSDKFMAIPPVFHSESGQSNLLKIIRKSGDIPSDRESDYKLVFNAIPASRQKKGPVPNGAKISFSLGVIIKLFYRPASLKNTSANAGEAVSFYKKDSSTVIARNDSEYNISLSQLILGDQRINLDEQPSMIRPFSTVAFKDQNTSSEAKWRLINDFGGESKEFISKIQDSGKK